MDDRTTSRVDQECRGRHESQSAAPAQVARRGTVPTDGVVTGGEPLELDQGDSVLRALTQIRIVRDDVQPEGACLARHEAANVAQSDESPPLAGEPARRGARAAEPATRPQRIDVV